MSDYEPILKKPEVLRDDLGRFEQHGKELAKTQKPGMNGKDLKDNQVIKMEDIGRHGGAREGAGRKPGIPNKVTAALKDMILGALDRVGGEEYLAKLAIENSSAFSSLLGKVLPSTMQRPESDGGLGVKITFQRIIVHPDGHREIEGVTPKRLPPASHTLPNDERVVIEAKDIKDLD